MKKIVGNGGSDDIALEQILTRDNHTIVFYNVGLSGCIQYYNPFLTVPTASNFDSVIYRVGILFKADTAFNFYSINY